MTFQQKLKRFSETHKMGVIAERVGITRPTMSRYISGAHKPRYQTAVKIAKELRVSVGWLLDDDVNWPPTLLESAA